MKIFGTIEEIRQLSLALRHDGKTVALVPTMGYLHEGHMALVDAAKKAADAVIVSIFVNPTQFAPNEDLAKYPRDFESDRKLCEKRGVCAIFAPSSEEMYPDTPSAWVCEEEISKGLCGRSRPSHFRGVATVVVKLFNATLPDMAVFGQKDAQQAAIIKRLVRDLNFPINIVVEPIVREEDGLAMSSRNKYLSADERKKALSISSSLKEAASLAKSGKMKNAGEVAGFVEEQISKAGGKVDYVEIVDSDTFEKIIGNIQEPALIAAAAFFGKTRLIDNIIC